MNSFEITVGKIIIWSTVIGISITVLSIIGFIICIKFDDWKFNRIIKKDKRNERDKTITNM